MNPYEKQMNPYEQALLWQWEGQMLLWDTNI